MSLKGKEKTLSSAPRLRSFESQADVELSLLTYYQYSPLSRHGDIRLLQILPGLQGSAIKCNVVLANLDNSPRYEALSYTWGDPKSALNEYPTRGNVSQMFSINVDGCHAKVGYNLESALQHLRHITECRTLWIDALCIDQNNSDERNEQVRLMGRIYSQASQVLCWLGETDKNADIAFETIEEICWAGKVAIWHYCSEKLGLPINQISLDLFERLLSSIPCSREQGSTSSEPFTEMHEEDRLSLTKSLSRIYFGFQTLDVAELARETFGESRYTAQALISGTGLPDFIPHALRDLLRHRSYWKRLWVFQECLLASEVLFVCGHHYLHLDTMVLIQVATNTLYIHGMDSFMRKCSKNVSGRVNVAFIEVSSIYDRKMTSMPSSLDELIDENSAKLTSEPRDAIYALLNVSLKISVSIEYNKAVSEVYIQAARAMINQRRSLDLICMAPSTRFEGRQQSHDLFLPSWVPNFSAGPKIYGLGLIWTPLYELLHPARLWFEDDIGISSAKRDDVLSVKGMLNDMIEQVYPFVTSQSTECWEKVKSLKERVLPNSPTKSTVESFWRSLFINRYFDSERRHTVLMTSSTEVTNVFSLDLEKALSTGKPPTWFRTYLLEAIEGKTFCITAKGTFALVLGDVKVGDHVFVARSATYPLILRPSTHDEHLEATKIALSIPTFYKFVGGAYVDGITDREGAEMTDGATIVDETVYLI